MKWRVNTTAHYAETAEGYRIAWVTSDAHGDFHNAYSPSGKHLEASYEREICKAACERHLVSTTPQLDFSTTPQPAAEEFA